MPRDQGLDQSAVKDHLAQQAGLWNARGQPCPKVFEEERKEKKRMEADQVLELNSLPKELLAYILSFLEMKELVPCMLVSKDWFLSATSDAIWYPYYINQYVREYPKITGGIITYHGKVKKMVLSPELLDDVKVEWREFVNTSATCGASFPRHASTM